MSLSLSFIQMTPVVPLSGSTGTAKLEVEGTPKVEDTGEKGNDGSPKLRITVNFKQPIPAGYTKVKLEVCTLSPALKCWPQGAAADVTAGNKSVTVEGWFHHSVDGKREYALIKVHNPTTKQTIEVKIAVTIPGDF